MDWYLIAYASHLPENYSQLDCRAYQEIVLNQIILATWVEERGEGEEEGERGEGGSRGRGREEQVLNKQSTPHAYFLDSSSM